MELYTLDNAFLIDTVIEDLVSATWAERYIGESDMNLVLPSTEERVTQLAEGRFVKKKGSKRVMQIESQSIENGVMTIVGKVVENFFNERYTVEQTLSGKVGEVLGAAVESALITDPFGGVDNAMPFFAIGDLDVTGEDIDATVPKGPLYDGLKPISETNNVGMAVYLTADAFSHEFEFVTYTGLDRTSDQFTNDRIRFSSADDTMRNVKELRSIAGFKNVVYILVPDWYTVGAVDNPEYLVVYAPGFDPATIGFDRRVLVIDATDIAYTDAGSVAAATPVMIKRGVDALANNNFTKMMDGEVIPQPGYTYGVHYYLGDIVELVGQSGVPQKAQITEYIHSLDSEGEKAYPTVSVVD